MPGLSDSLKTWEDAQSTRWKILVYGFPGAGKTTLAASFPNCLLIETDDNGYTVLHNERFSTLKWIQIRKFKELVRFVRALAKDKELLDSIDVICIDTWSEVQQLQRLQEIDGDILSDGWVFNQSVYSRSNTRLNQLLREITDLGKNLIFVSHMNEVTQGEGSTARTIIRPAVSNEPMKALMANLDGVFFFRFDGGKRFIQVRTGSTTLTKSRFPTFPDQMVDPTAEKMLPHLNKIVRNK